MTREQNHRNTTEITDFENIVRLDDEFHKLCFEIEGHLSLLAKAQVRKHVSTSNSCFFVQACMPCDNFRGF